MEPNRDGVEKASFTVIAFEGAKLPKEYLGLITSTFLRSLRYGNEYFKLITSDAFFSNYERYIKTILQRPGSVVRIAVLSDDHDVALGWSLSEHEKLHYIFVQREQRNMGIAKTLIPKGITTITHLTKAGASFWNNKLKHAEFNPFQ